MSQHEYIALIKAFLAEVSKSGRQQHRTARYQMARYICECLWKGQPLYLAHVYSIAGRKAGGYTGRRKILWKAFQEVLGLAIHMGVLSTYENWYILTKRKRIRAILRLIPPENLRKVPQPTESWFPTPEDARMALIKGGAK